MKLTQATIYRLTYGLKCACKVQQEFSDATYKTSVSEPEFTACEIHATTTEAVMVIKMMLTEGMEEEARKLGEAPPPPVIMTPLHDPTSLTVPMVRELPKSIRVGSGETSQGRRGAAATRTYVGGGSPPPRTSSKQAALPVDTMAEMQMEEVEEDENVTALLEDGPLSKAFDLLEEHDTTI